MENQERAAPGPDWCPGCGSWNLRPVTAGAATNFLCRECGRCWHQGEVRFEAVDPRGCPGCISHTVCRRRFWEPDEPLHTTRHDHHDDDRHNLWL